MVFVESGLIVDVEILRFAQDDMYVAGMTNNETGWQIAGRDDGFRENKR